MALVILLAILMFYLLECINYIKNYIEYPNFVIFYDSNREHRRRLAKKKGMPFDRRSMHDVILDYRDKGINALPNISPYYFFARNHEIKINGVNILPLGGVSNAKIISCNENGTWAEYDSDEYGFHNPKGLWGKGNADIVVLGASLSNGFCVNDAQDISSHIRRKYPKTINLASPGNRAAIQPCLIREYGFYLQPKVMLWMVYTGGEENFLSEKVRFKFSEPNSSIIESYLENDKFHQNLMHLQKEIDTEYISFINKYEKITKQPDSFFYHFERILKLTSLRIDLGLIRTEWKMEEKDSPATGDNTDSSNPDFLKKILEGADKTISSWGGKLYVVYVPSYNELETGKSRAHREILKITEEIDIPLIDLFASFLRLANFKLLFPFRMPGHYNAAGHELIAKEILKNISTDNTTQVKTPSSSAITQGD